MRTKPPGSSGRFASAGLLLLRAAALASFHACAFLEEVSHMENLSVAGFSPEASFVLPEEVKRVTVTFSAEMRRSLAEDSFSLKTDSSPVPGTFSWSGGGRTLSFKPLAPFEAGRSYTASVSAAAEDEYGNSLNDGFTKTFHTRRETSRPFLVSHSPAEGSAVCGREPVLLVFSEPMDPASVLSSFSLSPRPEGFFSWNDGGSSLLFTPIEDWTPGGIFDAAAGIGCRDLEGNLLAEEKTFRFFGPEDSGPEALSVTALRGGFLLEVAGEGNFLNGSLKTEKDERFRIVFSRSPETERRKSLVTVNPRAPHELRWESDGRSCILGFQEDLVWGTVYEIAVARSVRRFIVNGEGSVPLTIERVVYVRDTEAGVPEREELILARDYEFPDSASAAFDVYVGHGAGAEVQLASFLEAFAVEASNGCVDFETLRVETFGNAENETVFRVICSVNEVLASGTVTVTIGRDLRDGRGNCPSADYRLTVNKL